MSTVRGRPAIHDQLEAAAIALASADEQTRSAVASARSAGVSWAAIGASLGVGVDSAAQVGSTSSARGRELGLMLPLQRGGSGVAARLRPLPGPR